MSKLLTRKYQNNNRMSKAYGKFYGRIIHTETLTLDEFANHIASHGSPFDRATIIGVLAATCDCLVELTLDSKKVRLGDLGTFYMSAETIGEIDPENFTADNIKKLHLRFWPNMKRSYALDSVSNRKKASFADLATLGTSVSGGSSSGSGGSSNPDEPIVERP